MPHNRHNSGSNGSGNGGDSSNKMQKFGGQNPSVTQCCVPSLCHVEKPIKMDDLSESIKVICNNESCNQGKYMHKACFETWEENVLTYLRSTGRARSWSEKQRLQNLWTKKGYDLAYKACGCKCGKGHLRKDLDWVQPVAVVSDDQGKKKKHRKKKGNDKPSLIISTSMSNGAANNKHHVNGNSTTTTTNGNNSVSSKVDKEQSGPGQHVPSSQHPHPPHHHNNNSHIHGQVIPMARLRTSSVSSTGSGGSGGTSPPVSGSESQSPGFMDQMSFMKKFFGGDHLHRRQRHDSGSIFSRRQDYSSFNHLPRHKINSYHIKMEDDVNHGNDETRNLILSTLTANRMNRVPCILCSTSMIIFDKYPLIDGTFFVSPTQHSKGAVPCQIDGRTQYLNAVCMSCLEGWNSSLKCKSCGTQWKGSHLILGSMYSYDIFAAVPCCTDRLRCNKCNNLVTSPETHRIRFFSEYSHSLPCGYCGTVSHHYAKPIQTIFTLSGRG